MTFTCFRCKHEFVDWKELQKHKGEVDCRPCTKPCRSHVYIDDKLVHIDDYILHKDGKFRNKDLSCQKGHPIILVNCDKRKKHFRHKNVCHETNMSDWHIEWQEEFLNTEVPYSSENQLHKRFADVSLRDNMTIEFQHSNIESEEVLSRHYDYTEINGQNIIWILDGNTEDVFCEELEFGKGYLITFSHEWKYKSYVCKYDYVLLDIHNRIFKISVKKVRAGMILVKEFETKKNVIEKLINNPVDIWDMWKDDNYIKPSLTVHQKGAGNGKTYGIWKSIVENNDKDMFIVLTKQHSARVVIKNELEDQIERTEGHIFECVEIDDDIPEIYIDELKGVRKYIITITKKNSNKQIKVIVGTVDSFVFAITNNKKSDVNFFTGMLQTINETENCDKVTKTGTIRYAGTRKLTRKTEIWVDEAQDLQIDYYKAFNVLIKQTCVDVVIVGDKLQSLEFEKNYMTEAVKCYDDDICYKILEASNINRRVQTKGMGGEINDYVNFEDYGVIKITDTPLADIEIMDPIETFTLDDVIYADDRDKEKVIRNVDKIIDKVKYEVNMYNYKPKDFLFIFPIMKSNVFASVLETRLNEYWRHEVYHDDVDEEYKSYAILHKHQEGQVINTELSKESSRIVSIRSSKGDGRNVVFVLDCTEQSLKLLSEDKLNLIFESYFHVSLSRAKRKTYFHLQQNNDKIHERFGMTGDVSYNPSYKVSFRLSGLVDHLNKQEVVENILKKNGIMEYKNDDKQIINGKKQGQDWGFHCIRRAVYYNYALFTLLKYDNKRGYKKSQITTILNQIACLPIVRTSSKEFYNYLYKLGRCKDFEYFPLCNQSHKTIYKTYCGKIDESMNKIKKCIVKDKIRISEFDAKDATVLTYMIDILKHRKFHDTTPRELYDIIHSFEQNSSELRNFIEDSKNIKGNVERVLDSITKDNDSITWNIEHMVKYGGETEDFKIYMTSPFIGYDENTVYHIMMQTDYSELNHWDTMINILMDRFLIRNPNTNTAENDNFTRFSGKKIITYLFVLNTDDYKIFDWNWDEKNGDVSYELKELCIRAIFRKLSSSHTHLFNYYNNIKNDRETWKCNGNETPMEYMSKCEEYPKYVKDFFGELKYEYDQVGLLQVKSLTSDKCKFVSKLEMILDKSLRKFFGLLNNTKKNEEF